jgi:hypothetical protein
MTALSLLLACCLLLPPAAATTSPAVVRIPSPPPWTEAAIDPSGVATTFALGDFAYTRAKRKQPEGEDRDADVLVFSARALRNATHAAVEVRFLDEKLDVVFAGLARFDPMVLQWTTGKTATGSVVLDPALMPKVRLIVFAPI